LLEAALIAGLTAAGVRMPVAPWRPSCPTWSLSWLPAIPGWWAAIRRRQAGLL